MDLSIVVVNYNVRFFLEQTLLSVYKAVKHLQVEVFVVDNASIDHSVDMIRNRFPDVHLIANTENLGFSIANNQAIERCVGKYILLLNPDTVLQEDTLLTCFKFMESHDDAGALGVHMVDGKGAFLPESKRGIPTPMVAFYKLCGLSALFPTSKTFGKYHLSYLDKNKTHEVEVLSGAFMWIRKDVLDKIGFLDEQFFMYGEDIDLSYRVLKAGYKNYYLAETSIIHYKGESTKKSSYTYVVTFYNAMLLFAKKHFSGTYGSLLIQLIHLAIVARASVSFLSRLVERYSIYVIHGFILLIGLESIRYFWGTYVKDNEVYYPEIYSTVILPIYVCIWIYAAYLSGGYDKPTSSYRMIRGIFIGTIVISAITNFIDPFRFSKAIIILGTIWSISALLIMQYLKTLFSKKSFFAKTDIRNQIIVIGSEQEYLRFKNLMQMCQAPVHIVGFVDQNLNTTIHPEYLGDLDNIRLILAIYNPDEVVFCGKDIETKKIIQWMHTIQQYSVAVFKILPESGDFIIGSVDKNTQGELYAIDVQFKLLIPNSRRSKRIMDIILAFTLLVLYPFIAKKLNRLKITLIDLLNVISAKKSIVSIALPDIDNQTGLLFPFSPFPSVDEQTKYRIQWMYAKNYHPSFDIDILIKTLRNAKK